MPVLTLYRHGMTMGISPLGGKPPDSGGKREETKGWTSGVVRRNTAFLRSVDETQLTGWGFAFTFTVRDCPKSAKDWADTRVSLIKRFARMGMVRLHWLTEWQKRGVPHLHGAIWFPDNVRRDVMSLMEKHWLELAGTKYGAGFQGQHVRRIDGALGWFKYLAKHASRGSKNYQRASESIPSGWKGSTGRMWGHCGEWSLVEPLRVRFVDREGFCVYRRLVKRWRLADARYAKDKFRIAQARRMLKCSDRLKSSVRGASEWIPQVHQRRILSYVSNRYLLVFDETGEVVI